MYIAKNGIWKYEPIESGTSKSDVIEFVRQSMYIELHAKDCVDDSSVVGKD